MQQLLHVLLLTAPYPPTLGSNQHQDSRRLEVATAVDTSGQSIAIQQLRSMLQLLVPLVRNSSSSSKRLSAHEVVLLAQAFFHPALFACRWAWWQCTYRSKDTLLLTGKNTLPVRAPAMTHLGGFETQNSALSARKLVTMLISECAACKVA